MSDDARVGVLLRGGRVLLPDARERSVSVAIEAGRISAIGAEAERRGRRRARSLKKIELAGAYLAPGFIDLHCHGALGINFDTASAEELDGVLRDHFLAHGVTRMLLSLVPAARRELVENVSRVASSIRKRVGAGVARGIHLEGPFLSPERPGALPRESFQRYSPAFLDRLLDAGRGAVKTMTIAPERPRGDELIAHLRRRHVVPSFGHSAADFAHASRTIASGLRYVTHLFNAMRGMHHRRPGPIPAFLDDDRVSVELISDGHHVDVEMMRLVASMKPADAICLVSDSVGPCGLANGRYPFAGHRVRLCDGRVTLPDGTLAGSALTLDEGFRIQVERVGRAPAEVSVSASRCPSKIVAWGRECGSIAIGKRADLVVLSSAFRVRGTFLGGRLVHRKSGFARGL